MVDEVVSSNCKLSSCKEDDLNSRPSFSSQGLHTGPSTTVRLLLEAIESLVQQYDYCSRPLNLQRFRKKKKETRILFFITNFFKVGHENRNILSYMWFHVEAFFVVFLWSGVIIFYCLLNAALVDQFEDSGIRKLLNFVPF